MKLATLRQIIREEVRRSLKEGVKPRRSLTEKRTPWGMSDSEEDVGQGIKFYGTPSHGGYYVPTNLLGKISPAGRAYAKKYSGSENWYEEDIAWRWVVQAFPELFKGKGGEFAAQYDPEKNKEALKPYEPGGARHNESVKGRRSPLKEADKKGIPGMGDPELTKSLADFKAKYGKGGTHEVKYYNVFVRTWWTPNASYPQGREPGAGKKRYLARRVSYEQARQMCQEYNASHKAGPMSKKAEFEEA